MMSTATNTKKKIFYAALAILIVILVFGLAACNGAHGFPKVDYLADNDFEYSVTEMPYADGATMTVYEPSHVTYEYGLIFYVGTICTADMYDYLAGYLAARGFLVVIPDTPFAILDYAENEPTYAAFPNVTFFLGGHSQGGGAAVRRAEQNAHRTAGVLLMSPLIFNSESVNEDGETIVHEDSLCGLSLPTLMLEASLDKILTPEMIATSHERMDPITTVRVSLPRAEHMGFAGGHDFTGSEITDEEIEIQKAAAMTYSLIFMQRVISDRA